MNTVQTNAWKRGHLECIQDACENCPFAAIGGLEARSAPQAPKYIPAAEAADFIAGYCQAALEQYGADWATCTFSWQPALTIESTPRNPTMEPLRDNILVKVRRPPTTTASGLFVPEERVQKTLFGEVLAVGPGRYIEKTGEVRPVEIQPGQVVVLHGTAGHEVSINDDPNHLIVREGEVQAIVEEP